MSTDEFCSGDRWTLFNGDCIPHMMEFMQPQSVDFSCFSPPFCATYAYNDSERDLGNVDEVGDEARLHLVYMYQGIARVLKPGRVCMVHVNQLPAMKRTGGAGLHDFRGMNIRVAQRCGLVYEYDWTSRRNPQAQAIKTKSRELQFSGLESDRARSRGVLPDVLIKFRARGDNKVPIDSEGQVSRDEWIEWAENDWKGIRETHTLNVRGTKGPNDTRHICPLQLDLIERMVRLFSNPSELVFSPFAGIGSEGVMSLQLGRRFYGCELKREYFETACRNLNRVLEDEAAKLAAADAQKSFV